MKEKPKIEIQVDEAKDVWVAWTNTDLTEGRGYEYPLHIAETMETAQRLGAKGYVMGSPCRVTRSKAFRMGGQWFVPGRIESESKADAAKREAREAREAVLERARAAGLSEDDLELLRKP